MRRGEIWTVSGGSEYAGKPRPMVILQDDSFQSTASITMCGFTTNAYDAALFRLPVEPTTANGLRSSCRIMIDKITTVDRRKLGVQIGRLSAGDLLRVNQAVMLFLGLATPTR